MEDAEKHISICTSSITAVSEQQNTQSPKLYMIITNISKPANIKSLLLAGGAFGCHAFFIVGQRKFNFSRHDDDNSSTSDLPRPLQHADISILIFDKLDDCVDHVRHNVNAKICGVEIVDSALDVDTEPFFTNANLCLMMGNEGTGLNARQMQACDYFIRIRQFGGGTASLNVYVAASIVMQRFHQWSSRR